MQLKIVKPNKSISKAFYKQGISCSNIDALAHGLNKLFERIDEKKSEEHLKNLLSDFLKEAIYKGVYEINTKGQNQPICLPALQSYRGRNKIVEGAV